MKALLVNEQILKSFLGFFFFNSNSNGHKFYSCPINFFRYLKRVNGICFIFQWLHKFVDV